MQNVIINHLNSRLVAHRVQYAAHAAKIIELHKNGFSAFKETLKSTECVTKILELEQVISIIKSLNRSQS